MARKPNYSFEKRKKELDRKTKKEEKLRRRREGLDPIDETLDDAGMPRDADGTDGVESTADGANTGAPRGDDTTA